MGQFATFLFVLPFLLLSWAFKGIGWAVLEIWRGLIANKGGTPSSTPFAPRHRGDEWAGVILFKGDRVVTQNRSQFPVHIRPEYTGHVRDVVVHYGHSGIVIGGNGQGLVDVQFDAQAWMDESGATVSLPSFPEGIHMEYATKV